MSESQVLTEHAGVISGGHSCFVIRGDDGPYADEWDGNTLVRVINDDIEDLLVTTGDQYGPYAVTARELDGPPGPAADQWEDVVELSIRTEGGLFATELIDNDPVIEIVGEAGDYRLRVSARGRVAERDCDEDEQETEDPIEWYLLEIWRDTPADPLVVRLNSSYADFILNPPAALVIPEGEAGLAAAGRIGRDIDDKPGARQRSGELGRVTVSRTIRGTRRKLFRYCAHLTTWSHQWVEGSSWSWSGGALDYELGIPGYAYSHEHRDQLTGETGCVRTSFVSVEKPQRAVRDWNWLYNSNRPNRMWPRNPPQLLPQDTLMTVTLTQSRDDAGEPWTTIQIDHDLLPVEWLDDMRTYWGYQLSIADHASFGTSKN